KMAERRSSQEMASFVRAIIQADQLGISLGRILKVQAGDTRLKRQLIAEEKAMKAPIKMLFPTVIFIFPAMFLVVLGPAFLNLSLSSSSREEGASGRASHRRRFRHRAEGEASGARDVA